jgi:hypothetical protein
MPGFMTTEWAESCMAAVNAWPAAERRSSKLQEFWDWIDAVRPTVHGRLALSVRDLPTGTGGDTLVFDFDAGTATSTAIVDRAVADETATFLLAGSYDDWKLMLDGYDVGKMVMYRKLMLEKGDTLEFFMAAFFWTELLAAIQTVPVELLVPA